MKWKEICGSDKTKKKKEEEAVGRSMEKEEEKEEKKKKKKQWNLSKTKKIIPCLSQEKNVSFFNN